MKHILLLIQLKEHQRAEKISTFTITLNWSDLRWNGLLLIIVELREEVLPQDRINETNFFEKSRYLNLNVVVLAKHFQHKVRIFFKFIALNGP